MYLLICVFLQHWAHDLQTLFVASLPRLVSERMLHGRVGARYQENLLEGAPAVAGVEGPGPAMLTGYGVAVGTSPRLPAPSCVLLLAC